VAAVQGSHWAGWLAVCAAIAILTSALTLASFVKFFGASSCPGPARLSRKRPPAGVRSKRDDHANPQLLLALLCVLVGILPAIAYGLIHKVLASSPNGFGRPSPGPRPAPVNLWAGISGAGSGSVFVPLAVAAVLVLVFLLARFISRLGGAQRRAAVPWLCGYAREAECNRYVAHGFYGRDQTLFPLLGGSPASQTEKSADHCSVEPPARLNPEGTLK